MDLTEALRSIREASPKAWELLRFCSVFDTSAPFPAFVLLQPSSGLVELPTAHLEFSNDSTGICCFFTEVSVYLSHYIRVHSVSPFVVLSLSLMALNQRPPNNFEIVKLAFIADSDLTRPIAQLSFSRLQSFLNLVDSLETLKLVELRRGWTFLAENFLQQK